MGEAEVIKLFKCLADKSRLQILRSLLSEDMYVERLAQRLELTGFCQNLPDGDVLAELQGSEARIQYLLRFMNSLTRIRTRRQTLTPLSTVPAESGFLCL